MKFLSVALLVAVAMWPGVGVCADGDEQLNIAQFCSIEGNMAAWGAYAREKNAPFKVRWVEPVEVADVADGRAPFPADYIPMDKTFADKMKDSLVEVVEAGWKDMDEHLAKGLQAYSLEQLSEFYVGSCFQIFSQGQLQKQRWDKIPTPDKVPFIKTHGYGGQDKKPTVIKVQDVENVTPLDRRCIGRRLIVMTMDVTKNQGTSEEKYRADNPFPEGWDPKMKAEVDAVIKYVWSHSTAENTEFAGAVMEACYAKHTQT